jgi:hypothetical protein
MIYVFKLISGEEYIGTFDGDESPKNDIEYYNIVGPMTIVDDHDEYGGVSMKLRDGLMLSDDDMISFPRKFVMTHYPASKVMAEYYSKAVIYCRQYTKKRIEKQIKEATGQFDASVSENNLEEVIEEVIREYILRNYNPDDGIVN